MVTITTWTTYRVSYIVKYLKFIIIHLHLTISTEAHLTYSVEVLAAEHKHHGSVKMNT